MPETNTFTFTAEKAQAPPFILSICCLVTLFILVKESFYAIINSFLRISPTETATLGSGSSVCVCVCELSHLSQHVYMYTNKNTLTGMRSYGAQVAVSLCLLRRQVSRHVADFTHLCGIVKT